jgi:hypothetical protein
MMMDVNFPDILSLAPRLCSLLCFFALFFPSVPVLMSPCRRILYDLDGLVARFSGFVITYLNYFDFYLSL